jgi:Phage protein Gp138 N-terminal domain
VTFPIGAGDEVLVVFGERCIDGWWQTGKVSPQTEIRMHDLSDGFAIPCPMSQPKAMPNISSDSAQLRTNDGTSYVSVGQGGSIEAISNSGSISLTAGGDIDVTATGNLTVKATGTLTLDGQSVVITSGVVQIFDLPGAPSQPGQLFVQGKTVMYN